MEAAGQGHLRPGVPVRAARRRTGGPTAEYSISKWIYGELPFKTVLCSVAGCSGNLYESAILRAPVPCFPSGRSCRERHASALPPMLYRVLFMVVALLAATQAQEDPCLGEDYAEAHCARPPPACTAWTLASA